MIVFLFTFNGNHRNCCNPSFNLLPVTSLLFGVKQETSADTVSKIGISAQPKF